MLTDALSTRKPFPPEARCSLSCSSVGSRCCRCPGPGPCCPGPLAVEPGRCPGIYQQVSWSKTRWHLSSHILVELARCNVEVLPHALLVVADVLQLLVKAVLNVVFDEVDALPPLPGGRDHSDEDKISFTSLTHSLKLSSEVKKRDDDEIIISDGEPVLKAVSCSAERSLCLLHRVLQLTHLFLL